jgi:YebC/PmpR family DNA-binding regulatory protein
MAGHSKWSKVKHFKGALDAKRGKLFSRFAKEIMVAARLGGGDPVHNARLRSAVLAARGQNVPNDTIERAIKKGTGEIEGGIVEELVYEGYGPSGVAIIVETATDNKNRTAADLRRIFTKNHGHLAGSGAVSYLFRRRGQIVVPTLLVSEDRLMEVSLEAGADDLTTDEENFVVTTPPDRLYQVGEVIRSAGIEIESLKLTYIPDTLVAIQDPQIAGPVFRLCDALEDHDDVQNIYTNVDVPDTVVTQLSA